MSLDISSFPTSSSNFDGFSSPSSSPSSSLCELTPHDQFLSTVLTSFVGSIVTGLTGGFLIAFCTAWICWFASTRILVVGLCFTYEACRGRNLDGMTFVMKIPGINKMKRVQEAQQTYSRASTSRSEYEPVGPPSYQESINLDDQSSRTAAQPKPYLKIESQGELEGAGNSQRKNLMGFQSGPPTILGWMGWLYSTLYFPAAQVIWLVTYWKFYAVSGITLPGTSSTLSTQLAGNLKLVRAIGVSVTALPLTMDTKARYARMLDSRYGRWANRLFTWIHALATLSLGAISTIMLIVAVIQMPIPVFFVPIYLIFSTIWMCCSFALFPPIDGGMSPNSIGMFAMGLAMGVFGGAFTSAPAFGSMTMAARAPGVGLGEYLKCDSVSILHKFAALFP